MGLLSDWCFYFVYLLLRVCLATSCLILFFYWLFAVSLVCLLLFWCVYVVWVCNCCLA